VITGLYNPSLMPYPLLAVRVEFRREDCLDAYIPFVIDTGATATCIHSDSAIEAFGLTPEDLDPERWVEVVTLGGTTGALRYLRREATFGFLHDDGRWEHIEGHVYVGEMASGRIPSLLGLDLLRHFRLTLVGEPPAVTLDSL
jgi:predicted aspartyl protease